ncbi:hypothetical protein [Lactococcus petauri]|uniref:hypothetical protein n=1 Tax=Lactococcus petauri TaxID=1940789 RepID=UPI001F58A8C7|nr:hypothetical protein [Lactococcus petauri]
MENKNYTLLSDEELQHTAGGSSNKIWEGVGYVVGAVSGAFASPHKQKPNNLSNYTGPHRGII